MHDRRTITHILMPAALLTILALAGWLIVRDANRPVPVRLKPWKLMGTKSEFVVVVGRLKSAEADAALHRAEQRLRDVEAVMSVHMNESALSILNAADADEAVELPEMLVGLLEEARQLETDTDGAFDATCRPVLNLWKQAAETEVEPGADAIAAARELMGMKRLTIDGRRAVKSVGGLQIDLGALAKGWGVDQAFDVIEENTDASGVLVNIGGDLRCRGTNPRGDPWLVGIENPFAAGECGQLSLTDAAMATSGDYRRYFEVGKRRYSHIVDPRTGRPVEGTPSVTVVSVPTPGRAVSAASADAWATALSVLGPDGLKKLEDRPGLEAMIITGTPDAYRVHMTAGFRALLTPGTHIRLE